MDIFYYGGLSMNIETNQEQFFEEMSSLKRDIMEALSSENVEKYRGEYKGKYSPERFKENFIEKATLHIVFKYVLIRMIEETMKRVNVKLNDEGLEKWRGMSKNFRTDYNILYKIAENDVKREKDLGEIFREAIYDQNEFIDKSENIIVNYIPLLSKYDFSTLDANITLTLIDSLYSVEKREELQKFYKPSTIIDYLLQQLGLI